MKTHAEVVTEVRRLRQGDLVDITMIGPEHKMADYAEFPGRTVRMAYQRTETELLRVSDRTPGLSPISTVIWGKAITEDLPAHIFVPPRCREVCAPMVGIHLWLVDEIAPVV